MTELVNLIRVEHVGSGQWQARIGPSDARGRVAFGRSAVLAVNHLLLQILEARPAWHFDPDYREHIQPS